MNPPKKTFDEFLKDTLTANDYLHLTKLLSEDKAVPLSSHRVTKIKNNPKIMTSFEVITLARLVKKAPAWLSEEYHCGWDAIDIPTMQLINRTFAEEIKEGANT